MTCLNCGLLDKKTNSNYCPRFKKKISDIGVGNDCIYFIKEIYEDGERLTPQQHLLIQDQDFRSKKMQGPMK